MTLAEINAMDQATFVATLGWVFEHSPWIAEGAWTSRPFATREALHEAMARIVREADVARQLDLIREHPDLGARARMSDASVGEQAGAGLDQLTPAEFNRLQSLNADYRQKFGFPFIYAVKGSTKHDIIQALETRLASTPTAELDTALKQIERIAWFRLSDAITI